MMGSSLMVLTCYCLLWIAATVAAVAGVAWAIPAILVTLAVLLVYRREIRRVRQRAHTALRFPG